MCTEELDLVSGSLLNLRLYSRALGPGLKIGDTSPHFGAARGALLVVVLVGLVSLAPVQQDQWWQQSTLLPHFLMVADWSKNLILSLWKDASC